MWPRDATWSQNLHEVLLAKVCGLLLHWFGSQKCAGVQWLFQKSSDPGWVRDYRQRPGLHQFREVYPSSPSRLHRRACSWWYQVPLLASRRGGTPPPCGPFQGEVPPGKWSFPSAVLCCCPCLENTTPCGLCPACQPLRPPTVSWL